MSGKLLAQAVPSKQLVWANLIHLGYNMWSDRPVDSWGDNSPEIIENISAKDHLRCDINLWNDIIKKMSLAGMNMVVIDLGEGVRYESHPELAVKNSWTAKKLRSELSKIRDLGIEPIPKLNFSTAHDAWLGPYSRCVSTDAYYKVCGDLIAEVIQFFDKPRFFHLGYDEETAAHQGKFSYSVVRQHELWWHDFNFITRQVEKHGVRPWIWSDYYWNHAQEFASRMPKSVLQSNWYYGAKFDKTVKRVQTYLELNKLGYDQIPTASSWGSPVNFKMTVEYCRKHIEAKHLLGFMQTPWVATLEVFRQRHMQAIQQVADVIAQCRK